MKDIFENQFETTKSNKEFLLSDKLLKALNERRKNRLSGKSKTHSWEEVKEFTLGKNA